MDKKIKCNSKKNDLSMPVRVFCNDIEDPVAFYPPSQKTTGMPADECKDGYFNGTTGLPVGIHKIVLRFYGHMAEKFFVSFRPGDRGGDETMNPESDCFKELR